MSVVLCSDEIRKLQSLLSLFLPNVLVALVRQYVAPLNLYEINQITEEIVPSQCMVQLTDLFPRTVYCIRRRWTITELFPFVLSTYALRAMGLIFNEFYIFGFFSPGRLLSPLSIVRMNYVYKELPNAKSDPKMQIVCNIEAIGNRKTLANFLGDVCPFEKKGMYCGGLYGYMDCTIIPKITIVEFEDINCGIETLLLFKIMSLDPTTPATALVSYYYQILVSLDERANTWDLAAKIRF